MSDKAKQETWKADVTLPEHLQPYKPILDELAAKATGGLSVEQAMDIGATVVWAHINLLLALHAAGLLIGPEVTRVEVPTFDDAITDWGCCQCFAEGDCSVLRVECAVWKGRPKDCPLPVLVTAQPSGEGVER